MSLFSPSKPYKPSSPAALLHMLANTRSHESFTSVVLAKYLCPALDALPSDQQANLLRILLEADRASQDVPLHFNKLGFDDEDGDGLDYEDGFNNVETVDLEARSRKIRSLQAGGAENNQLLADEVSNWLPVLWRIGSERGLESKGVHSALILCRNVELDIVIALEVLNSKNQLIYYETLPTRRHISWVWRDILIKRLSVGDVDTTIAILRKLSRENVNDILEWFPSKQDEKAGGNAHRLDHWSIDIRGNIVDKLKGLLERLRSTSGVNDVLPNSELEYSHDASPPLALHSM